MTTRSGFEHRPRSATVLIGLTPFEYLCCFAIFAGCVNMMADNVRLSVRMNQIENRIFLRNLVWA
jgi:hypothetical protein